MSEPIARIVVRFDPARCCENRTRRMHWAQRSALFRQAKEVARLAWLAAGSPTAAGKVRASFVVRRARSLDVANLLGALKPILDGIFVGAVTPDDGPAFLEIGGLQQVISREWKRWEEVEVIVEGID